MNRIYPISFNDNYIWALVDTIQKTAVVVDPGQAQPIQKFLSENQLSLSAIFITHHHSDHIDGLFALQGNATTPVYGPLKEGIKGVTHPVSHADTINALGISFQIIETPAHTHGHITYVGDGMMFCGDTLFSVGCGRLFEGSATDMYNSLQKLSKFPDNTMVYCGHEYTASNIRFALTVDPHNSDLISRQKEVDHLRQKNQPTLPVSLGTEKKTNPFLRCHTPTIKRAAEAHIGHNLPKPSDVLGSIRQWKDHFS